MNTLEIVREVKSINAYIDANLYRLAKHLRDKQAGAMGAPDASSCYSKLISDLKAVFPNESMPSTLADSLVSDRCREAYLEIMDSRHSGSIMDR